MHKSVLLNEVLEWLDPKAGMTVLDGTVGFGGHAEAILEKLGPTGRLIGYDKDPEALEAAKKVLARFGDQVMLINDDFRNVAQQLREVRATNVRGMLLDLGVSSLQLDKPEKGFSFKADGPLDMRMDPSQTLTAETIVNTYAKEKLIEILKDLGEERFARRIVDKILEVRARKRIRTTAELESIIFHAVPKSYRYGRIHPATRSFQSLRMAVNKEMEALRDFLLNALDILDSRGRIVIISFHSLEDRIVKTAFREFQKENKGKILTKKPVTPGEAEVETNPRSRSAKLRAFEKV